jgi:CBS domain-containing protein
LLSRTVTAPEEDDVMSASTQRTRTLQLAGETAADLMTPSPVSIRDSATIREAIAFLVDKGISGAPVIDEAGHPVGVLTQTDILIHDREAVERAGPAQAESGTPLPRSWWDEFHFDRLDKTFVSDLMTPAVFSVPLNAPAERIVEEMRDLNVHRLFVVDEDGLLVGVITALDVIRHLVLPPR